MSRHPHGMLVPMMAALNAVLLTVVLATLAGYWLWVLGPFVRSGETSRAELLASSYAWRLESALQSGDNHGVQDALGRMVLLNDPSSGQPLVVRAEVTLPNGERLLAQSSGGRAAAGPPLEVMLFSLATFEQVGMLAVSYNGYFYDQARSDALRGMALVIVVPTLFLAMGNMAAGYVQQKRLHASLQRERDMADRHAAELEARVRERTAQLEAANKEMEAFTYSVSHDLRAPLRAIDGYSRILTEDHADHLDEDGRRIVGVVRAEAQRMDRLISDLLTFSRVGRHGLALEQIDMAALAGDVRNEILAATPGRAVHVNIGALPAVPGTPALIRQVWLNLIGNAVKFTRDREPAVIEVGASAGAGEHVYFVKDNGAGFDPRFAGKLFEVFQRLHSEDEFDGTGIGLAIVHRIVMRHGGRVWAEGSPGAGATFYFTLPEKEGLQT